MADVDIKFERENLEGIVAVGTYLIDAMKRFGIRPEFPCSIPEKLHFCSVHVTKGAKNLSALTSDEEAYYASHDHKKDERLACQTVIEKAGEIALRTKETKEDVKPEDPAAGEDYRKAFQELPLDKKISDLVQLEAIALSETISYIANSPYAVFEKVGDVMAGFGLKFEKDAKDASRPKEHAASKTAEEQPEEKSEV